MLIGLVIGLFLIGMVFLVKSNPYTLYYSMPAERIRYIDLESVGALYKKRDDSDKMWP